MVKRCYTLTSMKKATYDKIMLWLTIVMTVGTIIACYYAYTADQARIVAEESAKNALRETAIAQKQKAEAERKLAEVRDSLRKFRIGYDNRLRDALMALSKYDEVKNPENLENLRISAEAFVKFAMIWRSRIDKLSKRLDGNFTGLEQAIAHNDTQRIRELIKLIGKLSDDTDQVIEDIIQEIQKDHE